MPAQGAPEGTKSAMHLPDAVVAKVHFGELVAFTIDNLLFEDGVGPLTPGLLSESLKKIGVDSHPTAIRVGEMPDQGNRTRHQAVVAGKVTSTTSNRLRDFLHGPSNGIRSFFDLQKTPNLPVRYLRGSSRWTHQTDQCSYPAVP